MKDKFIKKIGNVYFYERTIPAYGKPLKLYVAIYGKNGNNFIAEITANKKSNLKKLERHIAKKGHLAFKEMM